MSLLANVYSNADRLKRRVKTIFDDPVGDAQQTMGRLVDRSNAFQALQDKAYADPKNPLRVTDEVAAMQVQDGYINGLLDFMNPLGMTKKVGKEILEEVGDRIVQAPKKVNVSRMFKSGDKQGIYRGSEAFGGITPRQLGNMRIQYLDKMKEGVAGRNWYDESSADILRWVGGETAKADDMANILATTSSRTPVNSNLMYANKGWNQNLVGDEIVTGGFPQTMGKTIQQNLANPQAAELGLKRSPFSAGLSVAWRGPEFVKRATHDIHDVRAWGITDPKTGELWSKGVPDAGHRFLDEQADFVTNKAMREKLGGADDWTPYRAQAAAWIAQKAKTDGTTVTDAARHYGTFAPDYQALVTREWVPGTNTGHLPEMHNAPDALKQEYSNLLESVVTGREGIDSLAGNAGALSDTVVPNLGFYEGAANPGFISRINVGKAPGSQVMDSASERVVDAVAAAHGLLGTQKQVASNYAGGAAPKSKAGAIRLSGGLLDDATMTNLYQDLQAIGADVPMRDPSGGARFLNFGDQDSTKAMVKQLGPVAQKYGLEPQFLERSGNLIPEAAPAEWSSKPFIEAIERSGPFADRLSEAMKPMAGEVLTRVNEFSAKNGWTQAPWFRPMMEGLRDGGLPKLKELVKAGVVPAFAFTAIGGLSERSGLLQAD
jgi:hypothetical protein